MYTLAIASVLLAVPAVRGHMALWDPSVYGFNDGDTNVWPLSGKSFNEWWFHGQTNDRPSATKMLVPGQSVTFELSCSKWHTSFTGNTGNDACPNDAGSYHAGGTTGSASGWNGNNEANLLGCALAIAYKSNPNDVKPEDFTVFSVQERCVRQKDTSFAVPLNLPKCPTGGCTCAWFWQGKNSANEMYMNGFKCDVQGGTDGPIPVPKAPRKGQIDGPTQPMYWANDVNNVGYEPEWATKPSYNSDWGWTNGAQTGAFGQGSTNPNPNPSPSPAPDNSTTSAGPTSSTNQEGPEPTTTSSRRRRPRPTQWDANGSPSWPVLAAEPTPTNTEVVSGGGEKGPGKCLRKRGRRGHWKRVKRHSGGI